MLSIQFSVVVSAFVNRLHLIFKIFKICFQHSFQDIWFSYLMPWLFPVYFQCLDFADKKLYQMILNILQTTLSPQTVCKGLCIAWCVLTLILVVENWANTKRCKNTEKVLKPWQMGTHLNVLSKSYPMNTNMTGLRWFSKSFAFLHVLCMKVAIT